MEENQKQITVMLTGELYERLEQFVSQKKTNVLGLNRSQVCRAAIEKYIETKGKK